MQKQQQNQILQQEKAAKLDKKLNYGKFVKEEYLPNRNSKKIEELNEIRARVASYNKKKPYL